jgi:murein L,D-transpeptidase YafK
MTAPSGAGSFLMVHGDCVSIGCYAMTDKGIDDIYRIVEAALLNGQPDVPVHAFPFRMTDKAVAEKAGHRWASTWANLKEGYDLFERTGKPPRAFVCGTRRLRLLGRTRMRGDLRLVTAAAKSPARRPGFC